jgi:hypothetical protein
VAELGCNTGGLGVLVVTSPALPTFAFHATPEGFGSRNGVVIFGNQMDESSKFVAHSGAAIIQVTGLKSGRRLSGLVHISNMA